MSSARVRALGSAPGPVPCQMFGWHDPLTLVANLRLSHGEEVHAR